MHSKLLTPEANEALNWMIDRMSILKQNIYKHINKYLAWYNPSVKKAILTDDLKLQAKCIFALCRVAATPYPANRR